MSRTGCLICTHKKAAQINERLINKPHSGESFQIIADYFGVSQTTLQNHYKGNPDKNEPSHISELLSKADDIKGVVEANNSIATLQQVKTKAFELLDMAIEAADTKVYGAPSQYLREIREQIKLWAELEGKLQTQVPINVQVNILQSPEWIAHETRVIKALEAFPQAREAVVAALLGG